MRVRVCDLIDQWTISGEVCLAINGEVLDSIVGHCQGVFFSSQTNSAYRNEWLGYHPEIITAAED